jgi:hypothetical protein
MPAFQQVSQSGVKHLQGWDTLFIEQIQKEHLLPCYTSDGHDQGANKRWTFRRENPADFYLVPIGNYEFMMNLCC